MNKKRVLSLALAAVLVLALALSGCGNGGTASSGSSAAETSSAAASSEPVVVNVLQDEIRTWDTTQCGDTGSGTMLSNTQEGLFRYHYDEAGTAIMQEAGCESYEISDDGLTYTFQLKENHWSDGEPVTAADYVYAVKRLLDPDLAASYAFFATGIVGAEAYNNGETDDFDTVGVKALDDMTVEYTLAEADGTFLQKVGTTVFFPLREDVAEEYGDEYGTSFDQILCSGPYVVTEWEDKDSGVMVKNDYYWNADSIKIDEVDMQYVEEAATRDKLFKQGDIVQVGGTQDFLEEYKQMAANGEIQEIHRDSEGTVFYFNFPLETGGPSGLMQNQKIRTAVAYSINNEEFCSTIYGRYTAANAFVPSDTAAGETNYRQAAGVEPWKATRDEYNYDADKLQALFKEGLEELGLDSSDLSQYTLTYLTYGESSLAQQSQEFVQQSVQGTLGVNFEINVCADWAQYGQLVEEEENWDLSLNGWAPDYPDPMTFMDMWISTGTSNLSHYKSDAYDALIDEAVHTPEAADRIELYKQAEQMLADEMVICPLYFRDVYSYLQPNIHGWQIGTMGFTWSPVEAWVEE